MLLDSPVAVRNPVIRKIMAQGYQLPRAIRRMTAQSVAYSTSPPIIVNSIPKSGTHLLLQVARGMPMARYYGTFIAWAPSWSLRKRSEAYISALIRRMAPGEVVGAHLHYSSAARNAIETLNGMHLLIVRHPGAILASEADYILNVSRYHMARRYYKGASSTREALSICLNGARGAGSRYPCFRERLAPYVAWLDDPSVIVVKFEDLVGARRTSVVEGLVEKYAWRSGVSLDVRSTAKAALEWVNPHRSHTYRKGSAGLWKEIVPEDLQDELREQLGDFVSKLGYS